MSEVSRPAISLPWKRIEPWSCCTIRTIVWAVVVLPQPDSPTSASISPAPTLNDTPSTACTHSLVRPVSDSTRPRGTG